jgi:hypothetical protein
MDMMPNVMPFDPENDIKLKGQGHLKIIETSILNYFQDSRNKEVHVPDII